jgi:hypothetical protein
MTSQTYNTADNHMAAENDLIVREDDGPEDHQFTPGDDQIMPEQHQIANEASEPHPAQAWVTGDFGPPAAAVPEHPRFAPVAGVASAIDGAHEPDLADTERWHEIQAMFVDDPRASIELAAGLVDDRIEAFVVSVKDRQQALRSAWHGDDAGTEDLRLALRRYRAFWNHLEDIPA